MIHKEFNAIRNADGSFSVSMDGKQYSVKDMTELVHFLENDGYEGVKEKKESDN